VSSHTPLKQSRFWSHSSPALQGSHRRPPQSTDVSFPFWIWSKQLAGMHN